MFHSQEKYVMLKSLANIEMVSPSTYLVEQHLVISEGADPVSQAVQEDQRLQGHLAQAAHHNQAGLRIIRIVSVRLQASLY